jgi:predicted AlkP superfamily pyrophosphatase or phosphodiesterase
VHRTAVLNVVGLTQSLLGEDTPHLSALARDGAVAPIRAVTPAVTCTAQATFLTGTLPNQHGIVANGWYFRDLEQIWFWRQANRLVAGEKVWETARRTDPSCTCAKMFWWYKHVQFGRLVGDAAADLPVGRSEDPGHLQPPIDAAGSAHGRTRSVSVLQVLGT